MPAVSEVTLSGDDGPEWLPVAPPFDETHVAVKPVSALPLFAGALKETDTESTPAVAGLIAGALGTVGFGMTALDEAEAGPVPTPFVAVTEHV